MEIDPIIVALGGVVSTLAGFLYRELVKRAERAESRASLYEEKWLTAIGMADMAADEAEKRRPR